MLTVEEISTFAKINKSEILHYFYGSPRRHLPKKLPKALGNFHKHELRAMLLLSMEEPKELCTFFQKDFFQLEKLMNYPKYKRYSIRKKQKGKRRICAPDERLKIIQKQLNFFLQAYYLSVKPNEVHGFIINPKYLKGKCNIVENAKMHTGKKYVLNIDLKDFFPSISAGRVMEVFTSHFFAFNEQIATALTLLTTYEGKLPTGAPTSPVISNFVCFPLDNDLRCFSASNGIIYSRYADDLTFSSNAPISKEQIISLIGLIQKNNFEVNKKKCRMTASNRKQTVTGLIVNEKVNVDRKLIRKIRAMLHDAKVNGFEKAVLHHFRDQENFRWAMATGMFYRKLKGYIDFVGQVRGMDDSLYIRFKNSLEDLVG